MIDQTAPQKITEISNVEKIYITGEGMNETVIAQTKEGELYTWGANNYGQLGIGNKINQVTPQKITGISDVKYVYVYGVSIIAQTGEGILYEWGSNDQTMPHEITEISNVSSVLYYDCAFAIAKTIEGDLYAWGNNRSGQCGVGSSEDYVKFPQKIAGINNIKEIYVRC